ncbi:MAG: 50S ribosomal protein L9 [Chlamydiae bacterium]|jgi:large subunit ribosomal protein L9|nr:50S ribosomal protein L9 [Chlamydiota bacterium]
MAKYNLLLLEDVINYGRKGDLVHVAPGFARNYLLPKRKALLATRVTIKMREKLQKERKEQAEIDRKESEKLALKLEGKSFETTVKVDPEGHLYGSVTAHDIMEIVVREGFTIEKKHVALLHPIKQIGTYQVNLRLPEGVEVAVALVVKPDREIVKRAAPVQEEAKEEISSENAEEVKEEPVKGKKKEKK